jgi:polyphosphate:AMP phosphotransferase
MLENVDLTSQTSKVQYKKEKSGLDLRLAELQRQAKELGIPVILVFEGWDASGKGTLINELIMPLDPRGFSVQSTLPPNAEESLRPFLWRFWNRTPARGRIAIFDRSWYRRVLVDRVEKTIKKTQVMQAYEDIRSFERQLADGGTVIIKFFLHIGRKEQKRRFSRLLGDKSTAWRVTRSDWQQHRQYDKYVIAIEDMLARTDSEFAPWTVVEAEDRRFATLKVFQAVIAAMTRRVQGASEKASKAVRPAVATPAEPTGPSVLSKVNLSVSLDRETYEKEMDRKQDRLRELEHEIYRARIPVTIVYEGWDAAGKGGNLKRLVRNLDPRGYEVVPVAAPSDIEKAHHYLWRFWTQLPKAGHITIFDRSWYGRVLVERVEGFCSETDWRRAYREINEMERHWVNFGMVLVKFWVHIDQKEQLRRFHEREKLAHKKWKITEEDWRNRKKWPQYEVAVNEMLQRTSTAVAPWTVVESNSKWYARIKALDTVIHAIEEKL